MSRMSSFSWILLVIFICTAANFFTTFSHQESGVVRSKEISISSDSMIMGKKPDSEHVRALTAEGEISLIGKGQKGGKGASGGSNNAHRPADKGAAATSFCNHFFTVSAVILVFSIFVS